VEDFEVDTPKVRYVVPQRTVDPVEKLFGPERCPDCGEALTPWSLQKRGGGYAAQQCKCDHPWSPNYRG